MLLKIKPLEKADYQNVMRIYLEGIKTGMATFETEAPDWETFDQKYLPHSRLVVRSQNEIVGWATLSLTSKRHVYRGVAEVSIYVRFLSRGQGVGNFLMKKLIESSEAHGIWTLQSKVFPQNIASIKIHHANGFRTVGLREKIGQLGNEWMDNLLLERRSKKFR